MPTIYGEFLTGMVRKDPNVMRMEAWSAMIEALGLSNIQLADGFPSETQVRRGITAAKYNVKKKELTH